MPLRVIRAPHAASEGGWLEMREFDTRALDEYVLGRARPARPSLWPYTCAAVRPPGPRHSMLTGVTVSKYSLALGFLSSFSAHDIVIFTSKFAKPVEGFQ